MKKIKKIKFYALHGGVEVYTVENCPDWLLETIVSLGGEFKWQVGSTLHVCDAEDGVLQ